MLSANARGLSVNTINDYTITFKKFQAYLKGTDPSFDEITVTMVRKFLSVQNVSNKTLLNYHIGLSALWTWAVNEELVSDHLIQRIQRPKPEKPDIIPYSEEDIRAILAIAKGESRRRGALALAERHVAMILILLDTGIRATELCELKINDVDLQNNRLAVWGKGAKERSIPFSANTGKAIWRWLTQRPKDSIGDYLFITFKGNPLTRHQLLDRMQSIGKRAGVKNITSHRFRHTFAINYLRNGGDIHSLKRILGHSTLQMAETYLAIAQVDIEIAHRRASPVANWKL